MPGVPGDSTLGPYDREKSLKVGLETAGQVKVQRLQTVVDATPNERGGIYIVCSTGYYYEGEGTPAYFGFGQALGVGEQDVLEMMLRPTKASPALG